MNADELRVISDLSVSNITYPKLMAVMESLEDDHITRNELIDSIRNYIVDDKKDQFQTKQERVCNALMLAVFNYIDAGSANG